MQHSQLWFRRGATILESSTRSCVFCIERRHDLVEDSRIVAPGMTRDVAQEPAIFLSDDSLARLIGCFCC
jgi:hypothetical protein